MMKKKLKNFLFAKIKKIFFPFYKNKEILKIFDTLEKDLPKKSNAAMFVGGCVRKYILDEKIDDIDIATIFTPKEIKEKFKKTDVKVIDTGTDHGTVTLISNNKKLELTTLRKDIKTYGRHADVSFTDNWEEDSERRDFTINAIYLDRRGNFFDPQLGIQDLKKGEIKFIGDPNKRIEEDYLRIIRFLRFALEYDHNSFEKSTLEAIKVNLNGIKNISKERIFSELQKIFKLNNFKKLADKKELKIIFSILFPEFKYLDRFKKFKYLADNDLEKIDVNLILSILLIDKTNNHEYFCHKYKVSNLIKEKLNSLAEIFLLFQSDKNFIKNNLRKNIYLFGKKNIKLFFYFLFFSNEKMLIKELLQNINNLEKISIPKFPFNGDYLLKRGISEGKKIGSILKALEQEWINNNYELSEKRVLNVIEKNKV